MNWPGHQADGDLSPPAGAPLGGAWPSGSGRALGRETGRALANFAVPGPRLYDHPELVHAIVRVKMAAARANVILGVLEPRTGDAILAAGRRVLDGESLDRFVLPVVQGGGGTSTHMNVNEVLADLAGAELSGGPDERVHPNDHVNRGQSTNDVMPTAIALAVRATAERALPGLRDLIDALERKAREYPDLEHLGRTCLQDAVALPVSAVHRAHGRGIALGVAAIEAAVGSLMEVPLGGTAVGTGIGATGGFARTAVTELSALTGYPLSVAADPYYALSSLEPLVAVAEAADRCARSVARVATDLRLLSSGPVGGLGEIELPRVQAGSSIMPGKVNPVIPELLMQVSFQVSGEATSARLAAGAGELEVSAMAPVVTLGVLAALERLGHAATIFADRCISGLAWNEVNVRANLAGSLSGPVLRSLEHGYDSVATDVRRPAGTSS